MGAFIARQPNGRLCRFSTVVDTVTHYNMTEEDYIEFCAEQARQEAKFHLEHHIRPFDWVKDHFVPNNDSEETFQNLLLIMNEPVEDEDKGVER